MVMNKIKSILLASVVMVIPLTSHAAVPNCISKQYNADNIKDGQIVINAPTIAEEGAVVSVGIDDVKNVPDGVHVKELSLFNEFRKEPVARFIMNDVVSANALKTRVRLRESSNIYAVAVLSNGDIVAGERFVKVTIGGCGGGGTSDAISRAERVCSPEKK